ncbi:rRNA-binding ribosome biosynthesis protein rpf2 [Malassezia japonica]|uniref:Ribosome production factor 2 homolog n=1 Tax=Malassezia japonica TaxID=223818 RepID=A0AAF0F6U4_9BASI|nr:rRNA-binding ribosome biosynthesis protein rpf2 [Malassezia japonica]WFD39382.1 rRNA-binding ribosome biosynthesis protein rpf2 [Malassezia japonica]
MLRTVKPKNARSKRALAQRESKDYENAKTAVFVKGHRTSEKVNLALAELSSLKKPDAIPFNKHNDVLPFEDASSIEFWGQKNDASLFVVGSSQKKRPDNLCWIRLFEGEVLDILEMGILDSKSMKEFKTSKPSVGMRPLFHFSGPEFAADAEGDRLTAAGAGLAPSGAFLHLKSLLLDFYRGEELNPNNIALSGLEYVISVSVAPSSTKPSEEKNENDLASLYRAAGISEKITGGSAVHRCPPCVINFRVYTAKMIASGTKTPRMELELSGPSFDFELRRRLPANDRMTQALRRPKTVAQKNTQGKGKRKNIDTDEMGDMVGRVHLGKQDLSQLNVKKVKGLRGPQFDAEDDNPAFDDEVEFDDDDEEDLEEFDEDDEE